MNMASQGGDEFSRARFSKRIERVALDLVVIFLVPLVNIAGQGGYELSRVRFSKGIEGVALVHGEQCVPLLEEFIQVVRDFHLGLGHLVTEGETSSNRVVDVEHVVFSPPRVRVLFNTAQLVISVHSSNDGSVKLEGSKHRGSSRTSLEPDHHRGCLRTLLCWKEPEEHVPVVGLVHSQKTRVALNILVHVLKLAGVNHSHLSPSFDISALDIRSEIELRSHKFCIRHREFSLHLGLQGPVSLGNGNGANKSKE